MAHVHSPKVFSCVGFIIHCLHIAKASTSWYKCAYQSSLAQSNGIFWTQSPHCECVHAPVCFSTHALCLFRSSASISLECPHLYLLGACFPSKGLAEEDCIVTAALDPRLRILEAHCEVKLPVCLSPHNPLLSKGECLFCETIAVRSVMRHYRMIILRVQTSRV